MTEGKTSLFISHRLASTRFCDRILFLKDGKITEEGTHEALIALCGGAAEIAGGIRYLLIVLFAGCVWPLTFWGFSRLGRR